MRWSVVLWMVLASPAWAHGDAAWIANNPTYRDARGASCCGVNDCYVARPGEIIESEEGWLHVPTKTRVSRLTRGIYPSTDQQTWICVRGRALRCVFPGAGL